MIDIFDKESEAEVSNTKGESKEVANDPLTDYESWRSEKDV